MKTLKSRLLPLLMLPLLLVGCSKDDEDNAAPSGPKEYQVEYRVTAVGYSQARTIIYRDATEAIQTEQAIALPKTYSFKRVLKAGDFLSCGAFTVGSDNKASVKCAILLDGKEVTNETAPGPDAEVVASYVMP